MKEPHSYWQQLKEAGHLLSWTLRLLWQSHQGATIALSLLTLIQAVIPVGQLWITKLLMDQIVLILGLPVAERVGEPIQVALFFVGMEAVVLLVGLTIGMIAAHVRNILQEHLVYEVQLKVLGQAARLDLAMYESPAYHDLLRRTQQQMQNGPIELLTAVLNLLQTVVSLLAIIGVVLFYNVWLVPLLALTTIPAFWALMHYGRQRFALFDTRTPDGRRAEYLSMVLSSDTYAKEVRVWGLTPYFIEQVEALRGRFKQENITLSRQQTVATIAGELLATAGYYGAYVTVIMAVVVGRLTLGDLTLYAGAFSRAQNLFEDLLGAVVRAYEIQLFANYLFTFLHLESDLRVPTLPQPAPTLQKELRLQNFSFTYPGTEKEVLHNLNVTIPAGQCVAIVGVNGSGKTTLVKCLLRLYDASEGAIIVDGCDLRDLEPEAWRAQTAVVFQDYARYHLTVQENIGFGHIDDLDNLAAIQAAAQKVGLHEMLAQLPQQYQTLLGRRFKSGQELSLGQWQRVAVARALLRDAPLLILDEPTAAMDAQAEYELYQQFKTLAQGRTTLLISHRFSTVRMADHILVLNEGEVIEQGNHDELLAQNGYYAYLFNLQAESYQSKPTYRNGNHSAHRIKQLP